MNNNKPSVSVCITTYYHEKYISQAIESVLKQKTNFEYEICISDDCSKDNTVAILKEFASKYKNIKLNLNETNIGLTRNFFKAYSMCSGKYIVDLSGDDYYIDDNKLQKQFDFLENNPNYIGVAMVVESRYDDETTYQRRYPPRKFIGKDFTLDMFFKGNNPPLNGLMFKNLWLNEKSMEDMHIIVDASEFVDDITTSIKLLSYGNIFIMPDVCTVYRIHRKSASEHNFNGVNRGIVFFKKHVDNLNYLYNVMPQYNFYNRYLLVAVDGYYAAIRGKAKKEFNSIYQTIPSIYRKKHMKLSIWKGIITKSIHKIIRIFQRNK